MTDIAIAAAELSKNIFGPHRSLHRLGGVRVDGFELVVRTRVPEVNWPADRAAYFDGHPVRWQFVGKETAS
jgi:hypothetical protein